MRSSVGMILNAFLSRQDEAKRERLLSFLSEKEKSRLSQMPLFGQTVTPEDFSNGSMLERVHWSWFLPTLKSYSLTEQELFLAALDESAAKPLSEQIPCKIAKKPLTPIGKAYLRQVLLDSLIGPHDRLIPAGFLPPSPLNNLLKLSKKKLTLLIDLLSMHDVASEVKQIVETKILKKLYSFLSEAQKKFLKQAAAKPEPFSLPKIGLDRWDGTEDSLRHVLHRRGLGRLGIALSGQTPALIWYVCHQLDIGRGNALFKLSTKEAVHNVIDAAARQVEELLENESW